MIVCLSYGDEYLMVLLGTESWEASILPASNYTALCISDYMSGSQAVLWGENQVL